MSSISNWAYLEKLQRDTLKYFWKESNPGNGPVHLTRERQAATVPSF